MADELILLEFWPSPFAQRVKIALAEKGIDYESKEENLLINGKSPLLLKMNPVNKQIPVLIHNGKPICESLNIVQYIDELWNDQSPFLPRDPYKRAQARFWADYIDKKIFSTGRKLGMSKGETQEEAKKELLECYKLLEAELGEKTYFGGETFGFVDIALIPFYAWTYIYKKLGNLNMEEECPQIVAWGKRCMERETVSNTLPDPYKLYDFFLELAKKLGGQ
ncbi:probable glutathione S-transferase parA [Cornus florida]|uniref:probable glutathione S-transferase parA n=1 Tax=Cornus florida TaxID=4283 RepID=UPI00289AF6F0|nr:probable glutathione S-transferase parA [Cornus florida]